MTRLALVATATLLCLIVGLLAPASARAEVVTTSSVRLGDHIDQTITLPTAKVGVPFRFTVLDAVGRVVPLQPYNAAPHTAFYLARDTYYVTSGSYLWEACAEYRCMKVRQSVVGSTLPGQHRYFSMTVPPQDAGRVGYTITPRPLGEDLATGLVSYRWSRGGDVVRERIGATYTITERDWRSQLSWEVTKVVPGSRPSVAGWFALDVPFSDSSVAPGDMTGDGVADFHVVTATGPYQGSARMWKGSRTSVATAGSTWTFGGMVSRAMVHTNKVNSKYSELWTINGDCLQWWRLEGAGKIDGAGNCEGKGWSNFDVLIGLNNPSTKRMTHLLARRKDGALFRYTPTTDWSGYKSMSNARQVGSGWNIMSQIVSTGDVTGDGLPDVLAVRRSDGTLWRYHGRSDGSLGTGVQVGNGWSSFTQLASTGDMTGDGRPDLLALRSDGRLYLYPNLGGRWAAPRLLVSGVSQWSRIV